MPLNLKPLKMVNFICIFYCNFFQQPLNQQNLFVVYLPLPLIRANCTTFRIQEMSTAIWEDIKIYQNFKCICPMSHQFPC